jgi:hypothetical protein
LLQPTPLQVVTSDLLAQGTIVQQAEFGVWPALASGGGPTARQAIVTVATPSGKTARYVLHRDTLAGDQWVIVQVQLQ